MARNGPEQTTTHARIHILYELNLKHMVHGKRPPSNDRNFGGQQMVIPHYSQKPQTKPLRKKPSRQSILDGRALHPDLRGLVLSFEPRHEPTVAVESDRKTLRPLQSTDANTAPRPQLKSKKKHSPNVQAPAVSQDRAVCLRTNEEENLAQKPQQKGFELCGTSCFLGSGRTLMHIQSSSSSSQRSARARSGYAENAYAGSGTANS